MGTFPNITICIPCYNNQKVIKEAIDSALSQNYLDKEILVIDDCSTDMTVEVVESYGTKVRLIKNERNLGIGKNLVKGLDNARGWNVIFLCADDVFTGPDVVEDYVKIFDTYPEIGIIGRYYYYYLDGYPGAIGVHRDKSILTSSCCPSGMAFRNRLMIEGTNKIFVEMPSIVAQYLDHYKWTMLTYDTVAARYSPGNNTGTKSSYYTESPTQNWYDLLGYNYEDFPVFITLKNRAPQLLWKEVTSCVKRNPYVLLNPKFLLYSLMALVIPGSILRSLTNFYRHRIFRYLHAGVIPRPVQN